MNNALPTPQAAYDTLFQQISAQVFFNKCASAGFVPSTMTDAQAMLDTAGKLRAINEASAVKMAEDGSSPFLRMNADLDVVMTDYGLAGNGMPARQAAEAGYKQAASELMQNPEIYNAVLSLRAHEAEQIRQELAAQPGN